MRFPAANRKFRGNVDDETGDHEASAAAPESVAIDAKEQPKTRTPADGEPETKKKCSCDDSAVERRDNCEEVINNEDQVETSKKVLQLVTDSCFNLTQINGQRKLGGPPPGWEGPPPGPGCEVFVGKIPRTLYEHEIYPIFRKMGEVYEIRLMMDFSGTNRGYCFVMFAQPEFAQRAIRELDDYEIRPGRRIGVVASINNCRLYLGQLPPDIPSKMVIKKICEITDDVGLVAVYRNATGQARYALISYKTHRGAAMARRRLVPDRASLFRGAEVSIDWAHPSMFPSNVVEESGICDGEGNVEILRAIVGIENRRHQQRRRARDDFLDHSICTYLQSDRHSDHLNQYKCIGSHQHRHVDHGHSSMLQDHSCTLSNGGNFNNNEISTTSMMVQSGQLQPRSFSSLNARDRDLLISQDHCQSLRQIDRNSPLPRSKESIEWRDRRGGICSSESGCSTRSSVSDKLDNSSNQTFGSSTTLFDMDRHRPRFDEESIIDHAPLEQYDPNMEKLTENDTQMIIQRLENLNVAASGSIYSDCDNCSSSGSSDKINFQKPSVDADDFFVESMTRKPNYDTIESAIDEKVGTETVNEPRNEDSLNLFDNYTFVSHDLPSFSDINANCVDVVPKQIVQEVNKLGQLPCSMCHFSGCNGNKLDACMHDDYQPVAKREERNSANNYIPTFSKSIGAEFHEARQITMNAVSPNEFGCTHRVDLIDHGNLMTVPNLDNDTRNVHARFFTGIPFGRPEMHNNESSNNILYGSDALANTNGYQEFSEKYSTVNSLQNANQCIGVERSPMPNYVQESNFSRTQFPTTPWTMDKSIISEGQYNFETPSGSFVNSRCISSHDLPNELIDPSAVDNTCKIQAPNSACTYNEIGLSPFVGRMGIYHDPWNKSSVNAASRCSPANYAHILEKSNFYSSNMSHHYHDSQNPSFVRSLVRIPMLSQNNTRIALPIQLSARATAASSRHQQRMFHKNSYQKSNCKFNGYLSMNNSSEHQAYARTSASYFVPCDHSTIMNTSIAPHVADSNPNNHGQMQSIDKNRSFPAITRIPKAGRPILSRSRID